MNCVCCGSAAVTERREVTARGYRRLRCRTYEQQFDERYPTGEHRLPRVRRVSDLNGARTSAVKIRGRLDGDHYRG